MPTERPTVPTTIRANESTVREINAWQVQRINAGLADVAAGRVELAETLFARIAAKHGWNR